MTNEKFNLIKSHPTYYKAKRYPLIHDFTAYHYLTISGHSGPGSQEFIGAIKQLYSLAYQVRFLCKSLDNDFVIPKLEGQWWVKEPQPFHAVPQNDWYWRIMMRMPDFVDKQLFVEAKSNLTNKSKNSFSCDVKFEEINEGKCVQMLHIGPYHEQQSAIRNIINKMKTENLQINGHHHEIYISDPKRTPGWKLKTILRYPVK